MTLKWFVREPGPPVQQPRDLVRGTVVIFSFHYSLSLIVKASSSVVEPRKRSRSSGAGVRGFERSGCENREEVVAGNGITTFYVVNFTNLGGSGFSRKEGRDGGITWEKKAG